MQWLLGLCFAVGWLLHLQAVAGEPPALGPAEAARRVNQPVIVEMLVRTSKDRLEKRGEIFLDSEPDFHDPRNLGVVITRAGAVKFKEARVPDPAGYFRGKTIRVRGMVIRKEGRPRIEVDDPRQIQVVERPAGREKPTKPRARDLGVPFEGVPGPLNAITDVAGVEVGLVTLISGAGKLEVGTGPVRTGVTAILPRGKLSSDPVFAGWFPLNGNGEMTGTTWVEESGFLEGPVLITTTHSVGTVRDAVIRWQVRNHKLFQPWSLPVVAETWDGFLNDGNGFHVKAKHVFEALDGARSGPVAEGNVGGGTGMVCYGFKGGTGTASRRLPAQQGGYTVGVLVQANHGSREQLLVAGVPVGREIPRNTSPLPGRAGSGERGSIIIIVATDAPLLPHQLKRLARRAALGLARTGATAGNGSGDIFLAFSTANPGAAKPPGGTAAVAMLANDRLTPLFGLVAEATEEAIINTLVAAETMTGADGHQAVALPHDSLRAVLRKYHRLVEGGSK